MGLSKNRLPKKLIVIFPMEIAFFWHLPFSDKGKRNLHPTTKLLGLWKFLLNISPICRNSAPEALMALCAIRTITAATLRATVPTTSTTDQQQINSTFFGDQVSPKCVC